MLNINKSLVTGAFFFLLGLFIFVQIPHQIAEVDNPYGPRLFPYAVSILLMISSVGIIMDELANIRKKKRKGEVSENVAEVKFDGKQVFKVVFVLGMMTAYVFLFDVIGFLSASLLYVLISLVFFKVKKDKWWYYPILIGMVFLIFFVFKYLMNVPLF